MSEEYNKIAIVSLDVQFAGVCAKTLSDMLGMTYCSTKDLLEYELSDPKRFAELTSEEYLLESEQRVFAEISSFCDVVVSLSYDNFHKGWKKLSKNCLLIFLKVKKSKVKDKINKIMFTSATEELEKIADAVVEAEEGEEKTCEKIVQILAEKL